MAFVSKGLCFMRLRKPNFYTVRTLEDVSLFRQLTKYARERGGELKPQTGVI